MYRNHMFAITGAWLALGAMTVVRAEALPESNGASSNVAITINGTRLTVDDLERKNPAALFQAKNAYFEAQRKAMEEYVDTYLLEQQARKEGLSVADLLNKHVNSKVPGNPPEEALRVYYEGVDTNESYEAVRGKIIDSIRERRIAKIKKEYLQSLKTQAKIAVSVAPPRIPIAVENAALRGVPNAPVLLVEYADYECPYCQQVQPALKQLESEYKGKIAFVYKDVPLPMHPNAQKAAEASRCAEAQGKYWEYHDLLLSTKQLTVPALKDSARQLGLNTATFEKCLDSGEKASLIKTQLDEAQSLGIQGTPSFFLNGRSFNGTPGYDQLRSTIEEELARITAAPKQQASNR